MEGLEAAEEVVVRPTRRIPNLLHFLLFLALTVFSLMIAEAVGLTLVSGPIQARLGNAKLQLGVELVGYCLTLAVAWFAFAAIWNRAFLVGVRWNWPVVRPRLVLVGFGLGFLSQAIESALPVPKHAPIEDLFRSPGIIWFLAGFGRWWLRFLRRCFSGECCFRRWRMRSTGCGCRRMWRRSRSGVVRKATRVVRSWPLPW